MRKLTSIFSLIILIASMLSGCYLNSQSQTSAVKSTELTSTLIPPVTSTPGETPTFFPSPTLEPTLLLGELQVVKDGGFSFQAPLGFTAEIQRQQIMASNPTKTVFISFYGGVKNPQKQTAQEIADTFTASFFKQGEGIYKTSKAQPITIKGIEGFTFEITGTFFKNDIQGQSVILMPDSDRFVFGLGFAFYKPDEQLWASEGKEAFDTMVNSITFLPPQQSNAAAGCSVSTDKTYGFNQDNPIKVGGGDFGGPSRERAYLDNLLGPKGESISYDRTGSASYGDTILDIFSISVSGKTVTLYIDEYSYTTLQAPLGFTCASAFPLSEP